MAHHLARRFCFSVLLGLSVATASFAGGIAIGERPTSKSDLRDLVGNSRSLRDFKGKGLVICVLGTECPLANLYVPRLIEMESKYRPKGVQFVAVYPNDAETLDAIAAHANDRDVPFPILKDCGQALVSELGIERTPEVCVLDAEGALRYRGRIDDQYSPAGRRPKAERKELEAAIDAVLAGRSPDSTETIADGCLIQRARKTKADREVTFHRDVERIMQQKCQNCHRPGQAGPMPLLTYQDVSGHGSMIAEVVEQRRMPPWNADKRYGHFRNDRSLSQEEVETLLLWHSQAMPEGDKEDAPTPVVWNDEWSIAKPDMVFELPEPVNVPAEGVVPYRYYFVPTKFSEDRWVTIAEARPGCPEVVHHVIVYIAAPGRASMASNDLETQILSIGGPGEGAFMAPQGTAIRVPKDAELIFEMHYTPNGTATTDRTKVGITFAKQPPERELRFNMLGPKNLTIPAGDPHYKQTTEFKFPKDGKIVGVLPHMHLRGKAFRYEAVYPDERAEVIANVPRYDFNWQTFFVFEKPLAVQQGTKLRGTAIWDNSENNPQNPDPTREVKYGLQTSEEMMLGWLTYVLDEPVRPQLPPAKPSPLVVFMFNSMDKNKDGLADPSEISPKMLDELRAQGIEVPKGLSLVGLEAVMTTSLNVAPK
jgi:hypothetical protein